MFTSAVAVLFALVTVVPPAGAGLRFDPETRPRERATITLRPTSQAVRMVIELGRARDTIRFRHAEIPRDAWTIESAGVRWRDGALIADMPMRKVVLTVRPDTTENGRGYLSATRVGSGWQLHGPALVLANHDTRLVPFLSAGWLAWPRSALARGYFYLGPRAQHRRRTTHEVIVGANVPASLRSLADSALTAALSEHARRFAMPLVDRPTMIITRDGPSGSFSYRGDVTDGGVVSLRFGRDLDLGTSPTVRKDVWLFVAHEAAHLWNSHQARADDAHPFLHEGGAEYAALRAAVATGILSQEDLRARLSARLTECRRQVGARDSLSLRMARGGAVYDCGTVLQWLADLGSTRERGGFDRTWRSLVSTSVQSRAPYSLQQFRSAQPSGSLATAWFDLPSGRRWDVFDERLRSHGVDWEDVPSSQEYVVAALLHLGRQVCARGASVGFALIGGRLRFDQEPQCGPISDGPVIMTLEDIDPLTDGATLFARVEQRCRSQEPVRLRADSNDRVISLPCIVAPPRPVAYRLTTIPPVVAP